jgi:hypothetical protein
MGRRVQPLVVSVLFSTVIALPAFAQSASVPHADAREFLRNFIIDTSKAVDQQIKDKEQFVLEFFDYKQVVDNRLTGVLGDLAKIINDYAQNKDGLEASSTQLFNDLQNFSGRFDAVVDDFPHFDEVKKILDPHMKQLTDVLAREFPVLGPIPANGFPLSNFYEFFQQAERRNSFGMGAFFHIEPLKPTHIRKTYVSKIRYTDDAGYETEDVIYEEAQIFENDQEVSHRVVQDNAVVLNERRVEDFSFLHGLPAAMRHDRVNERFIRIVEEYINLVNYYLVQNYKERGLIIPADHPQLKVPAGYTPETFVRNFIGLILAIQQPGPSS